MTTREQFFYDNAGHCHDPWHETGEEGHVRGAKQLAKAELYAAQQGWTCEWRPDEPGHEDGPAEVCILRNFPGKVLESLCGITGATDDYRRVVEAELALQAMGWPAPAPQEPQEAAAQAVPASGKVLTDEQVRRLHDVLNDIVDLTDCNCCDGGCDGTCTCSMAEALLRDLAPWPARMQSLTGQRFRTLIEDREEDDDYGEVIHPIGSTFVVGEPLHVEKCDPADHGAKGHCCGQMYAVLWEQAVCVATGETCASELCKGMWTIWSTYEIGQYATAVAVQEAATGPQKPQEAAVKAAPPDVVCSHCGGRYIEPLEGALWECYDCGELLRVAAAAPEPIDSDVTGCTCVDRHDGNCAYATGPQEPQEAAAAPVPRYTVNLHVISLHGGERVREVYQGGDETVMYSHVSAIEWTLAMTGGTAEIEIVEDGRERWIDYQDGVRDGLPQEAE